jgi:hypothetical protein
VVAVVGLYVTNTFTNAVALGLGDGRRDRDDELANALAGHVAAEVDHVQADAVTLQPIADVQRIGVGRTTLYRALLRNPTTKG